MNRRIAAFTIAAVAVLGLAGCSGSTAPADDKSDKGGDSAPADETNTDQSVEEACGIVMPKVQEATTAAGEIDTTGATDPQAIVDQFAGLVDGLSEAADGVSNADVKEATTVVRDNFGAFRDAISKALVEGDTAAASNITTIANDMTTSYTDLVELCS